MSEQIVKLTSKPSNPSWLRGRGYKHRRFKLKEVDEVNKRACIYGPIVWDPEHGWLPAPDHPAASDHWIDADQFVEIED